MLILMILYLCKGSDRNMKLPEALNSTYDMLLAAFSDGISEEYYWIVLYLLYDYMSDENLAIVMSNLVNKSVEIISNDIYKAYRMEFDMTVYSDFVIYIKQEMLNKNKYMRYNIYHSSCRF